MSEPTFDLVVTSPVAGYERGQRITDRNVIAAFIVDERASHVVKVAPLPAEGPAEATSGGSTPEESAPSSEPALKKSGKAEPA